MKKSIILVNPQRPENIGFICRAMKTHDWQDIRIVSKDMDLMSTSARKTAYGSHDILESVSYYETLQLATHDIDIAIGTTSKQRTSRDFVVSPSDLCIEIEKKSGSIQSFALVFGNESDGLTTSELNRCNWVSTIPLKVDYPSLNLAQSVLIYLYEFQRSTTDTQINEQHISPELFSIFESEVEELLTFLEMDRNPSYFQKLIDRSRFLSKADMEMLLSVLNKLSHRNK